MTVTLLNRGQIVQVKGKVRVTMGLGVECWVEVNKGDQQGTFEGDRQQKLLSSNNTRAQPRMARFLLKAVALVVVALCGRGT